jgi:DNA mismatch repair protein MutS
MSLINDYFNYTKKYSLEYGDKTVVLMQVGAFYEVYACRDTNTNEYIYSKIEDISRIAELNIASKNVCIGKNDVVMSGFRDYMVDKYVRKIVEAGYTAVVYSQDENQKNTTRSLTGIYSPGTFFSNECDSDKITNNIMCIWIEKIGTIGNNKLIIGVSTIDIYTGTTYINELLEKYYRNPTTFDEVEKILSIYNPSETIIITNNLDDSEIEEVIQFSNIRSNVLRKIKMEDKDNVNTIRARKCENQVFQKELFTKFWDIPDFDVFFQSERFNEFPITTQSLSFLLDFVYSHNPSLIDKIAQPSFNYHNDVLVLANHSLKQLNILGTDKRNLSSVCNFLSNAVTPMGRRKLNYLICNPTTDITTLNDTYDITDKLLQNTEFITKIRRLLHETNDIEKIFRKMVLKKMTPADIVKINNTLQTMISVQGEFIKENFLLEFIKDKTNIQNTEMKDLINKHINIDKATSLDTINFEDSFFRPGVYDNIDKLERRLDIDFTKLKSIQNFFSDIISKKEKKGKGKENSKYVKLNKAEQTGYYLMATSRRNQIIKEYIKGKKVVHIPYGNDNDNGIDNDNDSNDTITMEFNDATPLTFSASTSTGQRIGHHVIDRICKDIFQTQNSLKSALKDTFFKFCLSLSNFKEYFFDLIDFIVATDVAVTRTHLADKYNYCRPVIDNSNSKSFIDAVDLRHPLIEHINTSEIYVPNDILLGKDDSKDGLLLFGTNAVGKSSLIKSIGISIIMAQAGFFVPSKSFTYKPYKYLFTRILGNDDLHKGLSTFAVEMSELRTILKMADDNSIILGDELCSGTETSSAIAIFSSGLINLAMRKSTFLFATHFHEVLDIDKVMELENLHIKHMEVLFDKERDILIYDRKLKDGPGDSMYGLEVCKSLSLPQDFLDLANELRVNRNITQMPVTMKKTSKYNSKKIKGNCELCGKEGVDIHHLQHQQCADDKGNIGSFHKNHTANLINLCHLCHDKMHKTGKQHKKVKTSKGISLLEQ